MPLDLIFIVPGNYTIEDDGIPGNNTSVIKDGTGTIIFTFVHPADSLSFTVAAPGVNLTVNFTDSLGAADFRIGVLDNPAQTPDSIVIRNIHTSGDVTLVSNGAIIEGGSDAAADITAGTLIMSAQTGVGTAGNALETQTPFLEVETDTGGINLANAGLVQIGGLTDLVDGLEVFTSGDLTLVNQGSIFLGEVDLDPANPPTPLETIHGGAVSGNVSLTALGFNSDIIATTDIDAISVPRGTLSLTAGRDIAFGTIGVNFDNDVRASGAVTINAGRDFLIDGFSDLASDDFGLATGGNLVVNAGRNIHMRNVTGTDASIFANGGAGADVILTTGIGGALILDTPSSSGIDPLESNSGDVIINADRMLVAASSSVRAANGEIVVRPRTVGREILLGSVGDAALALELSSTEVGRFFAPTLRIGDGNSGAMTVTEAVSFTNAPTVILRTGTDLSIGPAASLIAPGTLFLRAGDNILTHSVSAIVATTLDVQVDEFGNDLNTGGLGAILSAVTATNVTLRGNEDADRLNGSNAGETILGNGGNDVLRGNGGNDSINGGTGIDAMHGGLGDDFMFVDHASDTVGEIVGEGNDRVFTAVSYTLTAGASIETFTTTSNGATTAINLTGNALTQTIFGNAGNNTLDSGGGGDLMVGLAGNDFYMVRAAGDRASETAGGGTDRVFAAVSFTLENNSEVEILSTISNGATDAINLTGNNLAQNLFGNAGANILDGKGGNDALIGMGGADQFLFTSTPGAGNVDTVSDFQVAVDEIVLENAIFSGLAAGALPASAFVVGAAAADAADRIIYNSATGALLFDADGTGATAAVQFATLQTGLALTASDFTII